MNTNIVELKEVELDNVQGGSVLALATVGAVTLASAAHRPDRACFEEKQEG